MDWWMDLLSYATATWCPLKFWQGSLSKDADLSYLFAQGLEVLMDQVPRDGWSCWQGLCHAGRSLLEHRNKHSTSGTPAAADISNKHSNKLLAAQSEAQECWAQQALQTSEKIACKILRALTEVWVSLSATWHEQGPSFTGGDSLGIDPNHFDRSQPPTKDHCSVIGQYNYVRVHTCI